MQRSNRQIAAGLIFSFIILLSGGSEISARKLEIPFRWQKSVFEVQPLFVPDTLIIAFLGDIMMHSGQIENALKSDGRHEFSFFSLIEDRIHSADIAVANMEFTLGGAPYTGYPCFSAPDETARYAADCGIDIFLAANNHIFDTGSSGAARTLGIYKDTEGIRIAGLYSDQEDLESGFPLIIRKRGIKTAFINFTYGTNLGATELWPRTIYAGERTGIGNALKKAETEADISIVLPHWGTEYELLHDADQEKTAEWLTANGADAIIGTHPHVVQDTSRIGNTPVVYSLGNAVSNMSAKDTQVGLMATLRIVKDKNGDIRTLPVELTWLWCSRPGGYTDTYMVIPIEEYIDKKEDWHGKWDYEKMVSTYRRIRNNF